MTDEYTVNADQMRFLAAHLDNLAESNDDGSQSEYKGAMDAVEILGLSHALNAVAVEDLAELLGTDTYGVLRALLARV